VKSINLFNPKIFLKFLILGFLLLPTLSKAEQISEISIDDTDRIIMSPSNLEFNFEPGLNRQEQIIIINATGETLTFIVELEEYINSLENKIIVSNGQVIENTTDKTSIDWINPEINNFILNHGQKMVFTVSFNIPSDFDPQENSGQLCVKALTGSVLDDDGIANNIQSGVNVQGRTCYGLNVIDFSKEEEEEEDDDDDEEEEESDDDEEDVISLIEEPPQEEEEPEAETIPDETPSEDISPQDQIQTVDLGDDQAEVEIKETDDDQDQDEDEKEKKENKFVKNIQEGFKKINNLSGYTLDNLNDFFTERYQKWKDNLKDPMKQIPDVPSSMNIIGLPFWSRRKKYGGVIYDIYSGKPLKKVKVSLFDENGNLKDSTFTDNFGNYFFLISKGNYKLEVHEENHEMLDHPKKMAFLPKFYEPNYFTQMTIEANQDNNMTVPIPVKKKNLSLAKKIFNKARLYLILDSIFYVGLISSIIILIINPIIFNLVIFICYMLFLIYRFFKPKKPKWGLIKKKDESPEPLAFVNIFDADNNLVARTVSDGQGRYALLLEKGHYHVKTETNYGLKKEMDLLNTKNQIMAVDIKLDENNK
jgi:hypothetical protein